jgi:hypothetical protein
MAMTTTADTCIAFKNENVSSNRGNQNTRHCLAGVFDSIVLSLFSFNTVTLLYGEFITSFGIGL